MKRKWYPVGTVTFTDILNCPFAWIFLHPIVMHQSKLRWVRCISFFSWTRKLGWPLGGCQANGNNQAKYPEKEGIFPSKIYLFIFLNSFLAFLCFCCRTQAFSSLGEQGLLSNSGVRASHCCDFSFCGAWALEYKLSSCGVQALVAPQHVESPQIRNQTHVPCIGRQILNHWTTREGFIITRKNLLLLTASKVNTRDLSQRSISPHSRTGEVLS